MWMVRFTGMLTTVPLFLRLLVVTCIYKFTNLHLSRFSTRIICIYSGWQTRINCKWTCNWWLRPAFHSDGPTLTATSDNSINSAIINVYGVWFLFWVIGLTAPVLVNGSLLVKKLSIKRSFCGSNRQSNFNCRHCGSVICECESGMSKCRFICS